MFWIHLLGAIIYSQHATCAEISIKDPVVYGKEKEAVGFTCLANLTADEISIPHWITWTRNGVTVADNNTVLHRINDTYLNGLPRYSISSSSYNLQRNLSQTLNIIHLKTTDYGKYNCTLNFIKPPNMNFTAEAVLLIQDFLPMLHCRYNIAKAMPLTVELSCISQPGYPPITLEWCDDDKFILNSTIIQNDDVNDIQLNHQFEINGSDEDLWTFKCQARNSMKTKECNIAILLPNETFSVRPPVQSTLAPFQSTLYPVQSTLAPVQSTLAPVQSTLTPVQLTLAPVKSTFVPVQSTLSPVQSTLVPVSSIIFPVQSTLTPDQYTKSSMEGKPDKVYIITFVTGFSVLLCLIIALVVYIVYKRKIDRMGTSCDNASQTAKLPDDSSRYVEQPLQQNNYINVESLNGEKYTKDTIATKVHIDNEKNDMVTSFVKEKDGNDTENIIGAEEKAIRNDYISVENPLYESME